VQLAAVETALPPLPALAVIMLTADGLRRLGVYRVAIAILFMGLVTLCGCHEDLVPHDMSSLLFPGLRRSEIFGFVAGLGTTFASLPDLVAMLKRRSSTGMNPRMAAIMGVFQILWIYYGLLIASRPVIAWNMFAVLINFLSVGAYRHFAGKERRPAGKSEHPPVKSR
jgi:uncharacterized protein with PQ loop repeat